MYYVYLVCFIDLLFKLYLMFIYCLFTFTVMLSYCSCYFKLVLISVDYVVIKFI